MKFETLLLLKLDLLENKLQIQSTGDDILNLLFAQKLLATLKQQLNVQDKSRSQVGGRLKVLAHMFQKLKCQHFSRKIKTNNVCAYVLHITQSYKILLVLPVFRHKQFHCTEAHVKRNLRVQHLIKS